MSWPRRPLLLVHQMGKVGSTAIEQSLRPYFWRFRILHTHGLNRVLLERYEEKCRQIGHVPRHVKRAKRAIRLLDDPGRQIFMISAVRDPLVRNLSAFFQNLWRYALNQPVDSIPTEQLIDTYMERFPHREPLDWFEKQVRQPTGIDIYVQDFDFVRERQIVNNGRINLLVLRAETDNAKKARAVASYLNTSQFQLRHANIGNSKPYAQAYSALLRKIRFDSNHLDLMYESAYARHFYTDDERQRMRDRWQDAAMAGSAL